MRARLVLLAFFLASAAQAQAPSPAQMGITSTTTPEVLQTLDSSKTWVPVGGIDPTTHTWKGRGAAIEVDQFGAKGDFINDDGPAIQAALNAAPSGSTVMLGPHPYWNKTQAIVVPVGVRLTCAAAFNKRRLNPPGYGAMPCTIYENAGTSASPGPASFKVYGAATDIGILHDAVHAYPTTTMTRIALENLISAFYGTGILVGDNDGGFTGTSAITQNVLVGGFGTCIKQNGAAQVQIRQILGDCTNGYDLDGSFDNNFLSDVEFWEFLTTSMSTGTVLWNITGMADNGSGQWRLTIASSADPPQTGEQLWVFPGQGTISGGTVATPPGGSGSQGLWTVTAVDATHVDLQGSATTVSTTGNTSNGRTYIAVASTANLAPGMTVIGAGIPAGATIGAVWRSRPAINLDQKHNATATASGVALSFANVPYSGSGGSLRYEKNMRSGTGFAIGHADGTTCSGCFAFGYLFGFNFRGGSFSSFTNSNVDGPTTMAANKNITPIGLQFTGDTSGVLFQTNALTTTSVHILNNTSGAGPGAQNVVQQSSAGGASFYNGTFLENAAGGIQLSGPSVTYGGAFLLDVTNPVVPVFIGVNTPIAFLYSNGNQPLFYGAGNLFGGNLDQQVPASHKAQTFYAAGSNGVSYNLYDAAQPLDQKYWRLQTGGGASSLCAQGVDDAVTTAGSGWCIHRSGVTMLDVTMGAPMIPQVYSIVTLPTCGTSLRGAIAYVTNGQATPPYLGAVSTTGSTIAPVFCNGSGWVYH